MPPKKPLRVVLVDDSAAVMEALKALISEIEGVEIIHSAEDAEGVEDAVRQLKPDVVVLDIRLPKGSGLDILKGIRAEKQMAPLIIVFSSEADATYRRLCVKLGADFFFDKSSQFDRMAEVLRSLVAGTGL
jgi:DNA-binding NarL/FixJ family response regulator